MVDVAGRHILFNGCACSLQGAPARQATIALARGLRIDMWEAPDTGCCGARADRRVGEGARRQTLAPLFEGARQGLDVVCLSPACRRVVAAHVPEASGSGYPVQVRDVVQLLDEVYGEGRLAVMVTRGLVGLRVALHGACHANHNADLRAEPVGSGLLARSMAGVGALLSGTTPLTQLVRERGAAPRAARAADGRTAESLDGLVSAVGATITGDVSPAAQCAELPLVTPALARLPGFPLRRVRPAPCLVRAAESGADVLVTPCVLCFADLNRQQRALPRGSAARTIPVLHVSQLLGLACELAPGRLALARTTVSARRVLTPFLA